MTAYTHETETVRWHELAHEDGVTVWLREPTKDKRFVGGHRMEIRRGFAMQSSLAQRIGREMLCNYAREHGLGWCVPPESLDGVYTIVLRENGRFIPAIKATLDPQPEHGV